MEEGTLWLMGQGRSNSKSRTQFYYTWGMCGCKEANCFTCGDKVKGGRKRILSRCSGALKATVLRYTVSQLNFVGTIKMN